MSAITVGDVWLFFAAFVGGFVFMTFVFWLMEKAK